MTMIVQLILSSRPLWSTVDETLDQKIPSESPRVAAEAANCQRLLARDMAANTFDNKRFHLALFFKIQNNSNSIVRSVRSSVPFFEI